MCESRESMLTPSRRTLVKAAAASVGLLAACRPRATPSLPTESASATALTLPPLTKEWRDRLTPDQFLELAKEGNQRFREGTMISRD